MDVEAKVEPLIGLFYDAAVGATPWSVALGALQHALGGQSAIMFDQPRFGEVPLFMSSGVITKQDMLQINSVHGGDVWLRRALERNLLTKGFVGRGSDVLPQEELRQTDFYNDALRPYDVEYCCASMVYDPKDISLPGFVSVLRMRGQPDFSVEDVEVQRRLSPHARRAASLWSRTVEHRRETDDIWASLELVPFAMLFVRGDRSVRHMNAEAERLLGRQDAPLRLVRRHSRWFIEATAGSVSPAGRALACLLSGTDSNAARIDGAKGAFTWFVDALCLDRRGGAPEGARAFVLTIHASDKDPALNGNPMQRFFQLTRVETALAEALMVTDDLQAAADRLRVSRNTAKTHLAAVFAKTGTKSQSQLTRLMGRLPAKPRFER
jgi:DNA-binding CsgD family transcriptional regulator